MNNNIPKTLAELYEAKGKCLNPALLNDDFKQQSHGKFVWHYRYESNIPIDDFVFITRHLTHCNQSVYFWDAKGDEELSKKIGQEDLNHKAKNEYLGYQVMRAMNVNVPDHGTFYDVQKDSFCIALEFIDGVPLNDYLSKPENQSISKKKSLLENSYQFFVPMIATGRWDIKKENMLIEDNQFVHFDFDCILEEASYWSDDIEESKKLSIKLLNKYIDPLNKQPHKNLDLYYFDLNKDNVLQSFCDAKTALKENKATIADQNYDGILFNINARIDACISHLKNNP